MRKLWKAIDRIVYSLCAILVGFFLVFFIVNLSERSKGPVSSLLDRALNIVYDFEHKIVLQSQGKARLEHLDWFANMASARSELMKQSQPMLLGASDSFVKDSYETIFRLEDSLGITFPLIHIYNAWGSKPEQQFPLLEVKTITEMGSIPVITWEPWVSDFELNQKDLKKNRISQNSMLEVASGTYDAYIKQWALRAKSFGKPIYLRFGHEMNDPTRYPWGTQYNLPEHYIDAWRHVYSVFKELNVDNIIWVWSPHLSYPPLDLYYPGDEYVDMVGCTVLNYGSALFWSEWWTFDQLFGMHYKELNSFDKPIMIAEFGSLGEGGDRAVWFKESMEEIVNKYDNIKIVLFFNYSSDRTVTNRPLNWSITDDPAALKEVRKVIPAPYSSISTID